MVYIPKRVYEDKPDIYTPFVPMDKDNTVEICGEQLDDIPSVHNHKSIFNKKLLLYIIIFIAIFYFLKQSFKLT